MLKLHPLGQFFFILLAVYVLWLGIFRFKAMHLGKKGVFQWKRHVILGLVSLGGMLGGAMGGMILVRLYWKAFFVTGPHALVALLMIPLLLFGLGSGLYMHYNKKKRPVLPLVHAAGNCIVLCLAVIQIFTGRIVYLHFVLGA